MVEGIFIEFNAQLIGVCNVRDQKVSFFFFVLLMNLLIFRSFCSTILRCV